MCWGTNPSPITSINYEGKDQEWILTLGQNSCSPGLNMKAETSFTKLGGHKQAGIVYLWIMLDIIGNIPPDVASGLKDRIKLFGLKGLS